MRLRRTAVFAGLASAALVLAAAPPAAADHTNPTAPLSPVVPQGAAGAIAAGEGTFSFVGNVGPMQGTDIDVFTKDGVTYAAGGTLGQGPSLAPGFVGQRIVKLTDATGKVVAPTVVADHGSARCNAPATSATGLQHDVQAVPAVETELLIDTTDAVGRCHDTPGGGLEILDVTGLGEPGFEVREIALMRFNGTSHTVTRDATRPWILYNNGADFGSGSGDTAVAMTWTDVVDISSCLGLAGQTLEAKRAACQPVVHRINYQPEWTSKKRADGTITEPANCHDITAAPGRLYCAALNATLVMDVTGLTGPDGRVLGAPLPCTTTTGTSTGAAVTDCALKPMGSTAANPSTADSIKAYEQAGRPAATGAVFLGTVNHPGRECGGGQVTCNTNTEVMSTEGVAVSHEADPALDGQFMFVTDERGGGVVPPGATCSPGLDNPIGNGGLHVFDLSDPANPTYALTKDGDKAVYIGTSPTPSPTFCTIHVIEQVPGEARIIAAYYDGGTKIVDYSIDENGRWSFEEVAAYRLPGANTWASKLFSTVDNADGTRTYTFVSNSFALGEGTARGLDVFSWTGPANPISGAVPPGMDKQKKPKKDKDKGDKGKDKGDKDGAVAAAAAQPPTVTGLQLPATGGDLGLAALALLLLPLAFAVRRLRPAAAPA